MIYRLLIMLLASFTALRADETNTIPIKFSHGRVILTGRINDSEPLTFLLDSACTIPTLHPTVMDALKIEPSGFVRINGIAGVERAPTYRGVVIDFGSASYSPFRVAVIPSEREHSRRRDGVIGSGFLRRYIVEIDSKAKLLRLYSPTNFVYSGKGEVIPFRFKDEIPVVKASIVRPDQPDLESEFEIDTGCDSGICIGNPFLTAHNLISDDHGARDEKFGVGGGVETRNGTLPALRLGKLEIKQPQTDFFMKGSPVDDPLAGHIGMGVLHNYKIIFDYSRKQLIIETL